MNNITKITPPHHLHDGRNATIDAVKAFAIICVVAGHCIQFGSGSDYMTSNSFFTEPLFMFIYSFHMPLFMMVSGYLFAITVGKNTPLDTIKKKAMQLLLPIIFWSLIPIIHKVCEATPDEISVFKVIKLYIYQLVFLLWFLKSIFINSAIVVLVRMNFKNSPYAYLLLLLPTFFIPDAANLDVYKYMYPYFILGYFYHKDIEGKIKMPPALIFIVSLVLYATLMLFFDTDSYIYTSKYMILKSGSLSLYQLHVDVYRFVVGLVGSVMIISLISIVFPKLHNVIQSAILFLGVNTMGVYIISDECTGLLIPLTKDFTTFNISVLIAEVAIVTLFSLLLTLAIKQSRILRCYLLGMSK